jgi:hypothetical protein
VIGIDVGEQAAGFTGVSTSVSTGVMALVGAGVAASLAAAKPGGGVIKLLTASIVGGLLGGAAATGLKYAGREGF